jgi:hypothetical protein
VTVTSSSVTAELAPESAAMAADPQLAPRLRNRPALNVTAKYLLAFMIPPVVGAAALRVAS